MKTHNYKAGDKVRIIGNRGIGGKGIRHNYCFGDIVTVAFVDEDGDLHCDGPAYKHAGPIGMRQIVSPKHVELVTSVEPEAPVFTRDDIKAGYLLEVKRDTSAETFYMTVVPSKYDEPEELGCCCPDRDWCPLHSFDRDTLAFAEVYKALTIVRVYGPSGNRLLLANNPEGRTLLWERKEEPKAVEMTVAEISEKLGYEVKIVKEK